MAQLKTAKRRAGFTRLDLAVVLAMCCVLVPVLTVASQRSEEDVRRLQCQDNLRQIGGWLHQYARDNDDALPRTGGPWAWDTPRGFIDSAVRYGVAPSSFFCPSGPADGTLIHFNWAPGTAVGIYIVAVDHSGLAATNRNPTIIPQPITVGEVTYTPKPHERELGADPTISIGDERTTAQFVEIQGGSPALHRAPHLDGVIPAGGNVLLLDGHTEWRNFGEMTVRSSFTTVAFWY